MVDVLGQPQLGRRLRQLRSQRELSRKDLSMSSGVSYPYLTQLERGERTPSLDLVVRLAGALGVDLEELTRGGTPDQRRSLDSRPPGMQQRRQQTAEAEQAWLRNEAYRSPQEPMPDPEGAAADEGDPSPVASMLFVDSPSGGADDGALDAARAALAMLEPSARLAAAHRLTAEATEALVEERLRRSRRG